MNKTLSSLDVFTGMGYLFHGSSIEPVPVRVSVAGSSARLEFT